MKYLHNILLIITLLNSTSLLANELHTKLVGVWKSQPESKDKFTCTFKTDASFNLTAVNKIYDLGTDGKYTLKNENNQTHLHLYDLEFFFARNTHYGGLVEFLDDNTLKLDLRNAKIDKKVKYPKKFGRNTIIFYRQ